MGGLGPILGWDTGAPFIFTNKELPCTQVKRNDLSRSVESSPSLGMDRKGKPFGNQFRNRVLVGSSPDPHYP